jgi:CHAT domain-containing protein
MPNDWVYHDLEISVDDDGLVELRSELTGEAQAQADLDLDGVALAIRLVEAEPGGQTNATLLKSLGDQLFRGLLPSPLSGQLQATLAVARAQGQGVRIRLMIAPQKWAALPWELLYDIASGTFLSQSPETIVSRYLSLPFPRRDVGALAAPLRILVASATPRGLEPFDAAREAGAVREALAQPIAEGAVAVDTLEHTTPRALRDALRAQRYTVVHFIGHASFGAEGGRIALEDEQGDAEMMSDEAFSAFFLGDRSVKVVLLSTCEGGRQSATRALAGLAPQIVARGMPAVIAMAYPVAAETTRLFSRELYHALAQGQPIDAAVQGARRAIAQDVGFDRRDFATPILFMRARDGVILAAE